MATAVARRSPGSRRRGVPELVDPRDGSVHDDVVYDGWDRLTPGKRYGRAVPRLFTAPLRELVPATVDSFGTEIAPATSLGFEVITFAREVLEVELMPWQRWLLIHMLEVLADGQLRFATAIVLVARQNGKSTLSQVLALWFMLAAGWPLVLGTAQDLTTAEEVWEGAVSMLEDDDELAGLVKQVVKVNGKKALVLTSGERYLVKAANRRAGRGLSGNLVLLDELREQQNWAAWGAITKTTQAQLFSIVVGLSNAGDITSVVLRYLRLMAHRALGDPDGIDADGNLLASAAPHDDDVALEDVDDDVDDEFDVDDDELEQDEDTLFIAEWSAKPGIDRRDRDGWAQANPALGHRIQERKIASDCRTDPEWVFRTEVLCQWPDTALQGPFPAGAWEVGRNVPGERADGSKYLLDEDRIVGSFDVCVDQSADRSMYSITAVGKRSDGKDQAELIAYRSGNDWIKDFLTKDDRCAGRVRRVTGQTRGAPVSAFMAALQESSADPTDPFRLEVVPWVGSDLINAHQVLYDAVSDGSVRHNVQPQLDVAAGTAATKLLTGGFVIDREASPADAGPLVAMCGALWLARKRSSTPAPPPPPPKTVRTNTSSDRPGQRVSVANIRSVGF